MKLSNYQIGKMAHRLHRLAQIFLEGAERWSGWFRVVRRRELLKVEELSVDNLLSRGWFAGLGLSWLRMDWGDQTEKREMWQLAAATGSWWHFIISSLKFRMSNERGISVFRGGREWQTGGTWSGRGVDLG